MQFMVNSMTSSCPGPVAVYLESHTSFLARLKRSVREDSLRKELRENNNNQPNLENVIADVWWWELDNQ